MESIISMKNVRKDFRENTALKNLTFDVQKGEIFGFLGPSGAGKTTTIKLLTSQLLPSFGEIKVFGEDVRTNKKDMFKNIGVLTDTSGVYERLSVFDNLALFADIYNVPRKNIYEVLEMVDMKDEAKKTAKKLSRGMKQRLMMARAVIHKPKLLFLDEPTSSLDPGTTLQVHKMLKKFNEGGTTIFLTTHNMEEADKLCSRVAFLNSGEIVEIGNPKELKIKYTDGNIKVTLKNKEEVVLKNNYESGLKIKSWMEEGEILTIHSMEPSLEKIFLSLTGREL